MAVLRAEVPVGYKTMVKRSMVKALRSVFTNSYPKSDFKNLNVVTQFPLTQVEYPAIIVNFQEGPVTNAGVGNEEYFTDPQGRLRRWKHRRFDGTIEYQIAALSPLDRDILSDALIEVLSFGDLNELQNNFFVSLYGAPGVDVGLVGLLSQLAINTDQINPIGESATIAPWQPEDVLVYTNGYTTTCTGGFYNTLQDTPALGYIQNYILETYINDDVPPDNDPGNQWSTVFDYFDTGAVRGRGVIGSTDTYHKL